MKKLVFLALTMAGTFCLQAQTNADSSAQKPHFFKGIEQFSNQAEFVKPAFEHPDSAKLIVADSLLSKYTPTHKPQCHKPLDSAKIAELKDSLQIIKRHPHLDSLAKRVKDSAGQHRWADSNRIVEFDSLKIAKHDSMFAKKPIKHIDSLLKKDSSIVAKDRKPIFGEKDRHHFDSTFAVRPIDSLAKDSTVAPRKSHKETTHLYPNPARGPVTVQADSTVAKIEILNATTGTVVYQNQNDNSFDLSELPSGVYVIKIQIGEELITKTITKP